MTFEEAKSELESYRRIKNKEATLKLRLLSLRDVKAKQYGNVCVQQSNTDKIDTRKLEKLKRLEERLATESIEAELVAGDIALTISKLNSPYGELLNLFYLQYFENSAVRQILRRTKNFHYCERQYYKIKNKAIIKYAEAKSVQ